MPFTERELRGFLLRYNRITTQIACDQTRDADEHPRLAVWVRDGVQWSKLSSPEVERMWRAQSRRRSRSFCNFLSRDLLKSSAVQYASIKRSFNDLNSSGLTGIYEARDPDSGDEPYAVVIELPSQFSKVLSGGLGAAGAVSLVGAGLWLNRQRKAQQQAATSSPRQPDANFASDFDSADDSENRGVAQDKNLKEREERLRDRETALSRTELLLKSEKEALELQTNKWNENQKSKLEEIKAKSEGQSEAQSEAQRAKWLRLEEENGKLRSDLAHLEEQLMSLRTDNEKVQVSLRDRDRQWEKKVEEARRQLELRSTTFNTKRQQSEQSLAELGARLQRREVEISERARVVSAREADLAQQREALQTEQAKLAAGVSELEQERARIQAHSDRELKAFKDNDEAMRIQLAKAQEDFRQEMAQLHKIVEQCHQRTQTEAELIVRETNVKVSEEKVAALQRQLEEQTQSQQKALVVRENSADRLQAEHEVELQELEALATQRQADHEVKLQKLEEREATLNSLGESHQALATQRQADHEVKLQELEEREANVNSLKAAHEIKLQQLQASVGRMHENHESNLQQLKAREHDLQLKESEVRNADERIAAAANELKIEREQLQAEVGRQVDERIKSQLAVRQEEYQHTLSGLQQRIQTLQRSDEQIERSRADVERASQENNKERERLRAVEADLERRERSVTNQLKEVEENETRLQVTIKRKEEILGKVQEESLRLVAIRSEVEKANQDIAERESDLNARERDLRAQQQNVNELVNEKVEKLRASEQESASKRLKEGNADLNQAKRDWNERNSQLNEALQEALEDRNLMAKRLERVLGKKSEPKAESAKTSGRSLRKRSAETQEEWLSESKDLAGEREKRFEQSPKQNSDSLEQLEHDDEGTELQNKYLKELLELIDPPERNAFTDLIRTSIEGSVRWTDQNKFTEIVEFLKSRIAADKLKNYIASLD